MPLLILPNNRFQSDEPLRIIEFLQDHGISFILNWSNGTSELKKRLLKDSQGQLYEIKAVDSALGSIFNGDVVSRDGQLLAAVPFDPVWAVAGFHAVYSSLYELGLGDGHPENLSMLKDWSVLRQLADGLDILSGQTSISEFYDNVDSKKIELLLEQRYLMPERMQSLGSHKLFKIVTEEKLFAQRWGLGQVAGSIQVARAFALEILSEHIPLSMLNSLATRAGLSFQCSVSLVKKDETIADSSSKPIVPRKRGSGKAQAAAEAEAKTNKRITSFFKPKST